MFDNHHHEGSASGCARAIVALIVLLVFLPFLIQACATAVENVLPTLTRLLALVLLGYVAWIGISNLKK